MRLTRRQLLAGSAAASLSLPGGVAFGQAAPTVEEVLFDPAIPVLGNAEGDVTIAEFFDYQCPYCKRGHADLMRLVEKDGGIRLVMKDWPIFGEVSFHAASLVLGAGDDYKKAMTALMATKARLSKEEVHIALQGAGLDPQGLQAGADKDRARIDGILTRNMDQANWFGFGGTPTFIIGTRNYPGAMDYSALEQAVAAARGS